MRNQPATAFTSADALTVLSVSPNQEDQSSLEAIIRHSKWRLLQADSLAAALQLLRSHDIAVVLCERDLTPGTWIDMLECIGTMSNPPSFILTSRLADESLWSLALNLNAWDVLAKPFNRGEVLRSIRLAWEHWHNEIELAAGPPKVMRAS